MVRAGTPSLIVPFRAVSAVAQCAERAHIEVARSVRRCRHFCASAGSACRPALAKRATNGAADQQQDVCADRHDVAQAAYRQIDMVRTGLPSKTPATTVGDKYGGSRGTGRKAWPVDWQVSARWTRTSKPAAAAGWRPGRRAGPDDRLGLVLITRFVDHDLADIFPAGGRTSCRAAPQRIVRSPRAILRLSALRARRSASGRNSSSTPSMSNSLNCL